MHEDHEELVEGHNVETGKHSVKKGTEVDARGKSGKPSFVSKAGHVEIAKHPIKKFGEPSFVSKAGHDETANRVVKKFRTTELYFPARRGNVDFVKRLVQQGAQLNAKNEFGQTALCNAAWEGHVDVVKSLVENGADVNAANNRGETALHMAAEEGHVDVVKYLVENGADVNATDERGETALHKAAWRWRVDVVKYLVENGADVNATDKRGETALYKAAWARHVDVVKYLIENDADVNATNKWSKAALHKAAWRVRVYVVKYLVENGADVNATDKLGKTALRAAAWIGHVDLVKCLVENGADVNATDKRGETALHMAVEEGHVDVVKYLVENGAEVNATDRKLQKIKEASRSLAVQFTHENPCCIRVIPYENDDTKSLTICLYVDTGGNGIPDDVKNAAEKMFPHCEIQCVDLQRRPLSKIVARLPLCRRQKGKKLLDLSKKIEKNLDVFENRLNVTAVCASYKVRNAVEEEIPCVTVFVLGKGRIPAKETDIQKIKEDNGHLFDFAEFDVVEGYYRPAYWPTPSSQMVLASTLCGGVGIGVEDEDGAGTLGGFVVDEEGEIYILSNDHVLNPFKSKINKDSDSSNETSGELTKDDAKTEEKCSQVIEHPPKKDYDEILAAAKVKLKRALNKIKNGPLRMTELSRAERKYLKENEKDIMDHLENLERERTVANEAITEIERGKPRKIAVYVDGLKDNVEIISDNNTCKFYVDVAIAKLEKRELNLITMEKDGDKTNDCSLYGFDEMNGVKPTGEIVDLETFVREIRAQKELDTEEQLTFLKIGRTTNLTYNGLIDFSSPELFVNNVSLPKPCVPALLHAPYWYCKTCKPSDISETVLGEMESDGTQECTTCKEKLREREFYSFWKHNCFVLRQRGKPFSDEGDSGSLIFDNRGRAWGLVHGKFENNNIFLTIASPLCVSLKALEDKCGKKLTLWCMNPEAKKPAAFESKFLSAGRPQAGYSTLSVFKRVLTWTTALSVILVLVAWLFWIVFASP